jgi:hypothetical protein
MNPAERRAMLEKLYRAFNERDIEGVMAWMAPGVDWPDTVNGGRLSGRAAVRAWWLKQWRETDPRIEPLEIDIAPDGSAHVRVDQLVRSLDGKILQNRQVGHDYQFDGAFISRMTIVDVADSDDDEDEED